MFRIRVLAAAFLTTAVVGTAAVPAQAGVRRHMIRAINHARSWSHRRHVRFSNRLSQGAASWARLLVQRNTLMHSSRAVSHGEGEIIEWHTGGRARIGQTVTEWLNSTEHRQVMLAGDYRRAGAGRAVGYMGGRRCTVWVVRFAR